MKPKRIQYLPTYEQTLLKSQRYINAICLRMGQDEFYSDMQQAGREGLWLSYIRFDPLGDLEFHPFAVAYIKSYIFKFLTNNARTIKIPYHQQNVKHKNHNPDAPTSTPTISTNQTLSEDSNVTIGDMLVDEVDNDEIDDQEMTRRQLVMKYIGEMKPRYQRIIIARYVEDMSLNDIGSEIGITKEAVRQQIQKAMHQLQDKFGVPKTKVKEFKIFNNNK